MNMCDNCRRKECIFEAKECLVWSKGFVSSAHALTANCSCVWKINSKSARSEWICMIIVEERNVYLKPKNVLPDPKGLLAQLMPSQPITLGNDKKHGSELYDHAYFASGCCPYVFPCTCKHCTLEYSILFELFPDYAQYDWTLQIFVPWPFKLLTHDKIFAQKVQYLYLNCILECV